MIEFVKNALLKGLVVLVPLVLLYLTLRELFDVLIDVATPIAELFPKDAFNWISNTEILAALLVVGITLILGGLAMIPLVRRFGRFLERNTLGHLPLYRMIKTLVGSFLELEDTNSFRPALVNLGEGLSEPAYIIEDQGAERIVVLIPWSPTSFAGSVKLVPRDRVQRLDLTLDEFSVVLANFGLGMTDSIRQK